jgi:hypothetical protein
LAHRSMLLYIDTSVDAALYWHIGRCCFILDRWGYGNIAATVLVYKLNTNSDSNMRTYCS